MDKEREKFVLYCIILLLMLGFYEYSFPSYNYGCTELLITYYSDGNEIFTVEDRENTCNFFDNYGGYGSLSKCMHGFQVFSYHSYYNTKSVCIKKGFLKSYKSD